MLEFLRVRLQQGTRTAAFPAGGAEFPERFRGRPAFDASRCDGTCPGCRDRLPSALVTAGEDGRAALDVGACLFAPEEATACEHGAITMTGEGDRARRIGELPCGDHVVPSRRVASEAMQQRAAH